MLSWMCDIKLQERALSKRFRVRLALDDIISALQQKKLRWYGHVLSKENNDWVKKCTEYAVKATLRSNLDSIQLVTNLLTDVTQPCNFSNIPALNLP